MTTHIAEVLKTCCETDSYNNDERTWLDFRFKLENYLTLVNEKYVALLHDAESETVEDVAAGTAETCVPIRTLSHTLYNLLATLTTGQRLRLVQRVPNRNGFEAWRQLVSENEPETAGRRFTMLRAVWHEGVGDNLTICSRKARESMGTSGGENLTTSDLDDNVKISVIP